MMLDEREQAEAVWVVMRRSHCAAGNCQHWTADRQGKVDAGVAAQRDALALKAAK